jgi:hypothetical protein
MSDARGDYEREICSPRRRITTDIEHTPPRRIVLLKRADGTDRNSPRDMPQYDGRGASKALLLAIDRARVACRDVLARDHDDEDIRHLRERLLRLNQLALEQVEREQAREQRGAA